MITRRIEALRQNVVQAFEAMGIGERRHVGVTQRDQWALVKQGMHADRRGDCNDGIAQQQDQLRAGVDITTARIPDQVGMPGLQVAVNLVRHRRVLGVLGDHHRDIGRYVAQDVLQVIELRGELAVGIEGVIVGKLQRQQNAAGKRVQPVAVDFLGDRKQLSEPIIQIALAQLRNEMQRLRPRTKCVDRIGMSAQVAVPEHPAGVEIQCHREGLAGKHPHFDVQDLRVGEHSVQKRGGRKGKNHIGLVVAQKTLGIRREYVEDFAVLAVVPAGGDIEIIAADLANEWLIVSDIQLFPSKPSLERLRLQWFTDQQAKIAPHLLERFGEGFREVQPARFPKGPLPFDEGFEVVQKIHQNSPIELKISWAGSPIATALPTRHSLSMPCSTAALTSAHFSRGTTTIPSSSPNT